MFSNFFRKRKPAASADAAPSRLPPGQTWAKKWPVLHVGDVPATDLETWNFRVSGLVKQELCLRWEEMMARPQVTVQADMHCVTSWSVPDQRWEGVGTRDLLALAGLDERAKFCMAVCEQGYTTNLPLSYLLEEDALLAVRCNGEPLSAEHGAPMRLVVPRLYAWKSAKWIRGLEIMEQDVCGYWENGGYHDRGDPWREERYR